MCVRVCVVITLDFLNLGSSIKKLKCFIPLLNPVLL